MGFNVYLRNEITRDISDVPDLNKETPALPSNREEDDELEFSNGSWGTDESAFFMILMIKSLCKGS